MMNVVQRGTIRDECATAMVLAIAKLTPMEFRLSTQPTKTFWISVGTGNSTWLTGLSKGVDYAVRMRAVNAVDYSLATSTQTTKTIK